MSTSTPSRSALEPYAGHNRAATPRYLKESNCWHSPFSFPAMGCGASKGPRVAPDDYVVSTLTKPVSTAPKGPPSSAELSAPPRAPSTPADSLSQPRPPDPLPRTTAGGEGSRTSNEAATVAFVPPPPPPPAANVEPPPPPPAPASRVPEVLASLTTIKPLSPDAASALLIRLKSELFPHGTPHSLFLSSSADIFADHSTSSTQCAAALATTISSALSPTIASIESRLRQRRPSTATSRPGTANSTSQGVATFAAAAAAVAERSSRSTTEALPFAFAVHDWLMASASAAVQCFAGPIVESLNALLTRMCDDICSPSRNMEGTDESSERAQQLSAALASIGVVLPSSWRRCGGSPLYSVHAAALRTKLEVRADAVGALRAVQQLPLSVISAPVKARVALLVGHAVGMKRLKIPKVRRLCAVSAVGKVVCGGGCWPSSHDVATFVPGVPRGGPQKVSPSYITTSAGSYDDGAEGEGSAPEAGEGHGPRVELFDIVSACIAIDPIAPPVLFNATVKVSGGEGEVGAVVVIVASDAVQSEIQQGRWLVFETAPGSVRVTADQAGAVASTHDGRGVAVKVLKAEGKVVTLAAAPPLPQGDYPLLLAAPVAPLFVRAHGSALWWNEEAVGTMGVEERARLLGWVAGQSLWNGVVLPVELPPQLFAAALAVGNAAAAQVLSKPETAAVPSDPLAPPPPTLIEQTLAAIPSAADSVVFDASLFDFSDTGDGGGGGGSPHSSVLPPTQLRQQIESLSEGDRGVFAEMQGVDVAAAESVDALYNAVVSAQYVTPYKSLFAAFTDGLVRGGLFSSAVVGTCSPYEVARMLCGVGDVAADVDFGAVFDVARGEGMDSTVAAAVIWPAVQVVLKGVAPPPLPPSSPFAEVDPQDGELRLLSHEGGAVFRQALLRFISGRSRPPPKGALERLTIEEEGCALSRSDWRAILHRLPGAHTCTLSLGLPDYATSILVGHALPFKITQVACDAVSKDLSALVTDSDKEQAFNALSPEEVSELKAVTARLILARLCVAVANAASFELE